MREFAGGFAGQLKVSFVKFVENGKLPESWKEINVLISPQRKKKLEFRNEWPVSFLLILTKKCRLQDSNGEVRLFFF